MSLLWNRFVLEETSAEVASPQHIGHGGTDASGPSDCMCARVGEIDEPHRVTSRSRRRRKAPKPLKNAACFFADTALPAHPRSQLSPLDPAPGLQRWWVSTAAAGGRGTGRWRGGGDEGPGPRTAPGRSSSSLSCTGASAPDRRRPADLTVKLHLVASREPLWTRGSWRDLNCACAARTRSSRRC